MIENAGCEFVSTDQMLVTNVCLMPYYISNEAPFQHRHKSTQVQIDLYEVSVLEINEKKNKLTVKITQYLQWLEPRIRANFSEVENGSIQLSSENFVQIWEPHKGLYAENLLEWESLYSPKIFKDMAVFNGYGDNPDNFTVLTAWMDWKATIYCNCLLYTSPSPRD